MNKIFKQITGTGHRVVSSDRSRNVKGSGDRFNKLSDILNENGFELGAGYSWYYVIEAQTKWSVSNGNNGMFDTLSDVANWIKKDMPTYEKGKN